jgi:hypothetical protein
VNRLSRTYTEIATSWRLWQEFADPGANDIEDWFNTAPIAEKVAILSKCFGPEVENE